MNNKFFKNLKIKIHKENFAIIKSKKIYENAFANIRYNNEITVIIDESKINKDDIISIKKNWKIISFDAVLDFNLVGFIAAISEVLSKANISIFVVSSFSTDHILVKKKDLNKAINELKKLGVKYGRKQ